MTETKKTVEQLRMLSVTTYLIGAILYLLEQFKVIDKNSLPKRLPILLIVSSVAVFLFCSTIKLCINKSSDNQREKNIVKTTIYTTNIAFSAIAICAAVLLVLNEFKPELSINDQKVGEITICSFFVILGAAVACLYYLPRLLDVFCNVCTDLKNLCVEDSSDQTMSCIAK